MSTQEEENLKNAQFRGLVIGKLEQFENAQKAYNENLNSHLLSEMLELKEFNARLRNLENWKIKVVATSSTIGGIMGFVISYVVNR